MDTNVALFATAAPERISATVRAAIDEGVVFLSVVSYWEVMIKSMKGSLVVGEPQLWWMDTIEALSLLPMALRPAHVSELRHLPTIHADPFDRILIAQTIAEELTFLTADTEIPQYASQRFRVIT